jgi:hypothetical protein
MAYKKIIVMPNVTKTFEQFKKGSNQTESSLSITVRYNEITNEVDKIISVTTYDFKTGVTTDITAIMAELFSDELDSMIDSIDWKEAALESVCEYETLNH